MIKTLRIGMLTALALMASSLAIAQTSQEIVVLTGLPATYSMTFALASGTHIKVVNVPVDGRPMNAQARFFERPPKETVDLLRRADAVVSIGKLWREDPLFAAARAQNIRVVGIDATEPYSATMPGVALVREPDDRAPWAKDGAAGTADTRASPLFWTGPSNAARSAEIVAGDLSRLSPKDADRIAQNLAAYRRMLFDLKQSYEARLAELDNLSVFALTRDFVYLTTDLGLLVDGYFVRQDIEWTAADLEAFRSYLVKRGIRVVIHKWEPAEPIRQAIKAAGATLVVLRSAETFSTQAPQPSREESYLSDLESDLSALYSALKR